METLEKNFKKVRWVGWERSITPHIEREKKVMEYQVGWDKAKQRGWFEIYDEESGGDDYYGGGGLEFNGNMLVGYDGVFTLDSEVIQCLKDWGATMDEFMEEEEEEGEEE